MNWDIVEGNWKQFKGKVKAQWGKLTDDHLDVIAGKRDQLAGKIQEATASRRTKPKSRSNASKRATRTKVRRLLAAPPRCAPRTSLKGLQS